MVHHEILPTPNIKVEQGVWTSYGEATIRAPAKEVFAAVLDFQSYSQWNKYVPDIQTSSGSNEVQKDEMIILSFRTDPQASFTTVPCQIIEVDNEKLSLCIRGCPPYVPTWLLLPEKVFQVSSTAESQCLFQVWETQSGPLAWIVKSTMGWQQSTMNQGIAEALKAHVEARHKSVLGK